MSIYQYYILRLSKYLDVEPVKYFFPDYQLASINEEEQDRMRRVNDDNDIKG